MMARLRGYESTGLLIKPGCSIHLLACYKSNKKFVANTIFHDWSLRVLKASKLPQLLNNWKKIFIRN